MLKHKVFFSFYHFDDKKYKEYFDSAYYCNKIINKSVKDGEYDSDNSDEYIKRLIREDKISDSSIVVVLIGPNTKKRKHVDWEIYAGLRASINGNAGLIGVLLPSFSIINNAYDPNWLPPRLYDNVKSGYAKIYDWNYFINNFDYIIETAYNDRLKLKGLIDNSRQQMKYNLN